MSPRRVVTTSQADEDIDQAIAYYVGLGADDAVLRFIDALRNATDLLAEYPSIGSARFTLETGIPELRDLELRRFPYVLLYTEVSDAVRVIRVLHTSRDIPAELNCP